MADAVPEHWKDDVLDRRAIGDFLYRLCLTQYQHYHSTEKGGALCMAIDADWGAGKSFFVQRWQKDLMALGHPVINFDAWANDLSDDPLIAFMANLQKGLEDWSKQHCGLVGRAGQAASSKLKAVMDAAPRAILRRWLWWGRRSSRR